MLTFYIGDNGVFRNLNVFTNGFNFSIAYNKCCVLNDVVVTRVQRAIRVSVSAMERSGNAVYRERDLRNDLVEHRTEKQHQPD